MSADLHSRRPLPAPVTQFLRTEQEQIDRLIDALSSAGTPEQKQYLMDEIERRFTSHNALEHEVLAVALASEDPSVEDLARAALEADHETRGALREIASMFPWARSYDEEVERVVHRLRSHFRFKEQRVYPVIEHRI
jgi:phage shock protein A